MSTWEMSEKPKRKGRVFAVVITRHGSYFVVTLTYYGKPPEGSPGFVDRVLGVQTKDQAMKVGREMLRNLKKGRYDAEIERDLAREKLCST